MLDEDGASLTGVKSMDGVSSSDISPSISSAILASKSVMAAVFLALASLWSASVLRDLA